MPSDVDICNQALSLIGHSPSKVTSLSGTDTTSVLCNLWFATTRDQLLQEHTWDFATKRAALVPNTTEPVFGYAYSYDLPSDFLRVVISSFEDEGYVTGGDYRIVGNNLYSNTGPGDTVAITAATQANPVVLTAAGHGLGDGVEAYVEDVAGMTEINDTVFTVDNPTTNTIELKGVNGSAYTAYSSGGTVRQLNVAIEYLFSETTTANWPAVFVDLMAYRLAAVFAIRITDNANIAEGMWNVYNRKLALARNVDAMQGTPRNTEAFLWTASRL